VSTWYLSTDGVPVTASAPAWQAGAADFRQAASLEGFAPIPRNEYRHGVESFEHATAARWLFCFGFDRAFVVQVEGFPEWLAFQATLAPLVATGFPVRPRPQG